MSTLVQIATNFSPSNGFSDCSNSKQRCRGGVRLTLPIISYAVTSSKIGRLNLARSELGVCRERWSLAAEGWRTKKKPREVVVRFNQGFGFNGGGGGGGGGDNGGTARLLGNLALAMGLTYLSVTGQLGWVLDAIVSVSLLAVILPIVGVGAFLWWAGKDTIIDSCPNCGNDFQIFRSTINEGLQQCPFCSQPFSVVGDKFVRDPADFSGQATTFGEVFSNFSAGMKKEKKFSAAIVDIEAEVKDAD